MEELEEQLPVKGKREKGGGASLQMLMSSVWGALGGGALDHPKERSVGSQIPKAESRKLDH